MLKTVFTFLFAWGFTLHLMLGFKIFIKSEKTTKKYFLKSIAVATIAAIIASTLLFFIVQIF